MPLGGSISTKVQTGERHLGTCSRMHRIQIMHQAFHRLISLALGLLDSKVKDLSRDTFDPLGIGQLLQLSRVKLDFFTGKVIVMLDI